MQENPEERVQIIKNMKERIEHEFGNNDFDRINKYALIEKIAERHGVPFRTALRVVNSQFNFVYSTIYKGEFNGVSLPILGKFHVNPKRLHNVNMNYAKSKKLDRKKWYEENEGMTYYRDIVNGNEKNPLVEKPLRDAFRKHKGLDIETGKKLKE